MRERLRKERIEAATRRLTAAGLLSRFVLRIARNGPTESHSESHASAKSSALTEYSTRRVIELRSRDEIEVRRPADRFVAAVLAELAQRTRVGTNVLELDRIAQVMIREHRATSCHIDYHPSFGATPFDKVLCVSVNDAVLHGLPHGRRLPDGDLARCPPGRPPSATRDFSPPPGLR